MVRAFAHGVSKRSLSYFSFHPVLHDWCNKGHAMCYPVCDGAYKRTLTANREEQPMYWFPLSPGARCSSVVRVFAHGAMGRRISPSWWSEM